MISRKEIDLMWSSSGDFKLDKSIKDLANTKNINYRAYIQRIMTRLQSNLGEWRYQPQVGTNISDFLGRANDEFLGEDLKQRIIFSLTNDGLIRLDEINVIVFPLSKIQIAVIVRVVPRGQSQEILLKYSYSTRDNKFIPRSL